MIHTIKRSIRSRLLSVGINVRKTSSVLGEDALWDIKNLEGKANFKTVIDIGANVGQSALRFCKTFPDAVIHSFEPVLKSFEEGRKNTVAHPSIIWHHLAMGEEAKRISFYSSGTSELNSTANLEAVPGGADLGERNDVSMARLDDVFADYKLTHIDLLKTDTEGMDRNVLNGATGILADRRVTYILCEVGFTEADLTHSYFPPIAAFLEGFGYRLVHFYGISNIHHFKRWGVAYADALFALHDDQDIAGS